MKQSMIVIVWCLLFCIGCSSPRNQEGEKRTIIVSIEPMRFLVESIAEDLFQVECMVPRGGNPETYEPLPSQLVGLAKGEAYLRIGPIGFEQAWIERLSAVAPSMQLLDMSEGIAFIHEEESDHGDHHHGGVEPHIWTSPRNARLIASNICRALCRLSPADSMAFQQRRLRLDSLLLDTDRRIQEVLSGMANKSFMIYHPTLSYFARDYGLHQLCIEEGGKEPSPYRIQSLIEEARRRQVRVIFVQREFDMRHAEVLAAEIGCRVVVIDPLSYDWADEMLDVAQELAE